jgi:hypothetical protein
MSRGPRRNIPSPLLRMSEDFENGMLSEIDTIKFFSVLIRSKFTHRMNDMYKKTAFNLIDSGVLDSKGNILINLEDFCG